MHTLNDELVELVLALIRELDEQAGMAGDDDAGRAFKALYHSAAKTVVNQAGEAAHIMGRGCESLLETANNYMATESAVAAEMLAAIDKRSAAEPYSGKSANCTPAPRGRGEPGFLPGPCSRPRTHPRSVEAQSDPAAWPPAPTAASRPDLDPGGIHQA